MRQFIFSSAMKAESRAVLDALVADERADCSTVLWVETEIPEVAALLALLDTAEEIPAQESASKAKSKQKKMAKRVYTSGQLVECKICHRQTLNSQICKSGECKTCRMNAHRLARLQAVKKLQSKAPYNPLLDKPDYGAQESKQERLARPKIPIKLDGLSGRKVG